MPRSLILLGSALLIAGTVHLAAQSAMPPGVPSPGPDPAFVQNAIAALQQQRNSALDQVAQAQAQLAVAQGQLASTKKELEDLKAQKADESKKNFTPVPEKK